MAQNYEAPAFLMVALVLIAAATPTAYGQVGNLAGRLTGNCNGTTAAISNATVILNCTILGSSTTLGLGRTNANGTFNINVVPVGVPSLLPTCGLLVTPPINQTLSPFINCLGTSVNATLSLLGGTVLNITLPVRISISANVTTAV